VIADFCPIVNPLAPQKHFLAEAQSGARGAPYTDNLQANRGGFNCGHDVWDMIFSAGASTFITMPLRLIVSVVITLVAFMVLFLILIATETALTVWHYLRQAPLWVQVGYGILLVGLPLVTLTVFWTWFRPGKRKKAKPEPVKLSVDSLQDALVESARQGVDVSAALEEIQEQRKRQSSGEIYIAIYGEVSAGKSSLVKALLPEAEAEADPRAGTTTEIRHFSWTAPSGDRVVIADLPGFNLENDRQALEETRRAHLVIFLCDGDLTASQAAQIEYLSGLDKPLVLALNKSDRYPNADLELLLAEISGKTGVDRSDVVAIRSGGREEVVQMLGEGIEQRSSREREPRIESLRAAVQKHLDQDQELMENLRQTAVLLLANEKLEAARDLHRSDQAEELVSKYSRRAVIGALAAVAPGSDLVIQGVLATRLIRELSALYDVPVKDIEIEQFLQLAGNRVKNMTALTLAIAGNAFKAFPGVGTISGGVIHAVAYGMIFDSLGRAAADTLASRGELRAYPAAKAFEDLLNEHLESGAVRFAKLAVDRRDENSGA
jgi:GTP-binding protein EngB required for normal cell division